MQNNILIYQSSDGKISVNTTLNDNSLWLSQKLMATLFECTPENILLHIKNIYDTKELDEEATTKDFLVVQTEGSREVRRNIKYYNLDIIISVGYRVNSLRGTQFRIWSTQRLREYLLQGFSLDEAKLKSGKSTEYFDKLQSKLREIRLSERLFYQKIKDIYTTSVDYNPKDEKTKEFFTAVQNKLLWAISQKTAAELVYSRVDISLPFLGMHSCDKEGQQQITANDIITAKNYLNEDEMKSLGLLVEQYLAFAESMAQSKIAMTMSDWIGRLEMILQMNGREVLTHHGKISHELAKEKAKNIFNLHKQEQKEKERKESIKEIEDDIKRLRS